MDREVETASLLIAGLVDAQRRNSVRSRAGERASSEFAAALPAQGAMPPARAPLDDADLATYLG